ncbi:MAG: hypothetical protein ABIO94_07990, partial [Opitutaceae bacterium]
MTPRSVALVSLMCNAVLAAVLLRHLAGTSPRSAQHLTSSPAIAVRIRAVPREGQKWENLTAGPVQEVAERLRQKRFPLSVQRAIMTARLEEEFAARRAALNAEIAALPYWRNDPEGTAGDPRLAFEVQLLQRQFDRQLLALVEPGRSSLTEIQQAELQRTYGNPA